MLKITSTNPLRLPTRHSGFLLVIPAQAGIHCLQAVSAKEKAK